MRRASGLENDEYVRKLDGYLPTAEVAFIDEIFKANSAILNALLTLLNERLFDNGNQRLPVPLLCMVHHTFPTVSALISAHVRADAGTAPASRLRESSCSAVSLCPLLRRWAPPMSCQRARSWTRCTIASSSGGR